MQNAWLAAGPPVTAVMCYPVHMHAGILHGPAHSPGRSRAARHGARNGRKQVIFVAGPSECALN